MGEAPTDQEEERSDLQVVADTLAYLARSLVEHTDEVSVEVVPGDGGGDTTVFRLHVNPDDLGRVIGRGGRTARAIRQVTRASAAQTDIHAFIEIAG
jgi:hypothetical protein